MKAPLLRSGAAAIPQSHVPPDARVALVTAAGSPAGQAIGLRLALQGASVGLADADRVAAQAAAEHVRAAGGQAEAFAMNAEDWTATLDTVRTVRDRWSRLDIMVNVSEDPPPVPFLDMSEGALDASFDAPLLGLMHGVRAAEKPMRAAATGCIVNVFACGGGNNALRSAADGAAEMLTRAAAVELAPLGIRVAGVAADSVHDNPTAIANAVAFLTSPDASYVTGTTLVIAENDVPRWNTR